MCTHRRVCVPINFQYNIDQSELAVLNVYLMNEKGVKPKGSESDNFLNLRENAVTFAFRVPTSSIIDSSTKLIFSSLA